MPPFNEPSRIDQSLMAELRSSWLSGRRTPVEDVVRRHPELARHTETLQDLIYQEYCLRRELGEQPSREEYFRRFPSLRPELEKLFAVDSAVANETVADHSNEAREVTPPIERGGAGPTDDASSAMRFKKLRFHAKGGLGEVHVAEDQELHREVALKEIQAKHADDPKNQQRFKLEAEITGGLEHPGIVPVYGLGTHADGRPFYAMRFIRGDSLQDAIRDYHVEYRGDPIKFRQLLRRFSDVCNAMQYAHDRGVLHRDLKPGNIMLGKYGETMVVDWGLAKTTGQVDPLTESHERPLQPASSDQSAPTEHGTLKGTPAYMSPEQASGEINRLGPATDVYSLGATLYHLLTGRAPFTNPDLSATLQMIRQGEVQSPCQVKVNTPKPLSAICMKAMALRPEDRYPSARRLTEEIENWLADEPVDAYIEPLPARARRWMRKHPGPVAALAVSVVLGLLGAGTMAFLNGLHARELADRNATISGQKEELEDSNLRLEEEKAMALATTNFLVKCFRRVDPVQDGHKLTVYEVLLRGSTELEEESQLEPLQKATILHALGESFYGLGLYEECASTSKRAFEIFHQLLGPTHLDTLNSMNNLAIGFESAGRLDLALPLLEGTLQIRMNDLGNTHRDTLTSMGNLAVAYESNGDFDRAVQLYEETYQRLSETLGPDHIETLTSMNNLANGYLSAGKLDLSVRLYEKTLSRMRLRLGDDHPLTLIAMSNLGSCYDSAGELNLALSLTEEAVDRRKSKLGEEHPDTLMSINNLAQIYRAMGRPEEALSLHEQTLSIMRAKLGDDHPSTLTSMSNLAASLSDVGRNELAQPLFEEVLRRRKAVLGQGHPDTLTSMHNLAAALESANKLADALELMDEALRLTKSKLGDLHPNTLGSMNNLAHIHQSMGRFDLALPLFEETLRIRRERLGRDHPDTLTSMNNLAAGYEYAGRIDMALPLYEETLRLMKAKLGEDHPETLMTMRNLAALYLDAKQEALARGLFDEYLVLQRTKQGANDPAFAATLSAVAGRLLKAGQFSSAEPYLKECLEIRQAAKPDEWITFDTHVMLGRSLLGQKKFTEAETTLLTGYEGLQQREAQIPPDGKIRLTDALQHLVEFYTAIEKPDEAAKWQAKLTEHEASQSESPPAEESAK